jgi:hypothetical protein
MQIVERKKPLLQQINHTFSTGIEQIASKRRQKREEKGSKIYRRYKEAYIKPTNIHVAAEVTEVYQSEGIMSAWETSVKHFQEKLGNSFLEAQKNTLVSFAAVELFNAAGIFREKVQQRKTQSEENHLRRTEKDLLEDIVYTKAAEILTIAGLLLLSVTNDWLGGNGQGGNTVPRIKIHEYLASARFDAAMADENTKVYDDKLQEFSELQNKNSSDIPSFHAEIVDLEAWGIDPNEYRQWEEQNKHLDERGSWADNTLYNKDSQTDDENYDDYSGYV